MERVDLEELQFITPVANLESIMIHGIVCHSAAEGLGGESIANADVQEKRAAKKLPNGNKLHDYANLYICARNPMMYVRRHMHAELCVLRVDTAILDVEGVLVTDQNAATKYVRFAAAPDGLSIVDRDRTFAVYWTHAGDEEDQRAHRHQKCAEVLVPSSVSPDFIVGAHVSNDETAAIVNGAAPGLETNINANLFFR